MDAFLNNASLVLTVVSLMLSAFALGAGYKKIIRVFVYRDIRNILNIKDGDRVLVICSELPNPEIRQLVEDREFIYLMKYGDLDAWVEVIFSLLRVYPNIDVQIMSSGEALNAKVDLGHQIILIGGPDYNLLVRRLHAMNVNRMGYNTEIKHDSTEEITLVDKITLKTFCFNNLDKDYGYIERIKNPFDESKQIIFFGGCHTVGVTAAAKFISAFSEGRQNISKKTLMNAEVVAHAINRSDLNFLLLIEASKIGSSIASPFYRESQLFVGLESENRKLVLRSRALFMINLSDQIKKFLISRIGRVR